VTVKVPLQLGYRHPPSCTDLDSRRELARPAEPVQGVRVQAEATRRIRNGDQVDVGALVVLSSGEEGHVAPLAMLASGVGLTIHGCIGTSTS
jgi:hypothetical protein